MLVTVTQEYAAAGFPALTVPSGVYPQSDTGLLPSGRVEPDLEAAVQGIEAVTTGAK